ncbi:MAG: NUDIX domain-containing protein [Nanoarchaeota archaeon]|nr:NUDIX domain-containing protein [Nanoarchaeota archaeon]MBU1028218.1 NUDIX domain-containing protein [Nanoarchaeota archaeon]
MENKNTHFKVFYAGVIFDPAKKKILIGRKNNDSYLPGVTWCFPGGKLLHGEDIDKVLKKSIKNKTGYGIKNLGTIFSKVYPEQKDLMTVFFLCEVFEGEEKAGEDITELKWADPEELETLFTTSFHPRLKEYIMNLK